MSEILTSTQKAELTVIVVSFNTRELTLRCLGSLFENTKTTRFDVVVYDNASKDNSVEAIAAQFPDVTLIASDRNIGFSAANNIVAETISTKWMLLLNPDTEVLEDAVDNLVRFGEENPKYGIYGGRTVFSDGSLNIASCWNRITPWSAFCDATGLRTLFPRTEIFDSESIGSYNRDTVRSVDIVVGCFFLIRTNLWSKLNGFNTRFWMYGEEADLCLRAKALGYQPHITPDATIMHLVGAASQTKGHKLVLLAKGRMTLIRLHWHPLLQPWGAAMMWLWSAQRVFIAHLLSGLGISKDNERLDRWSMVWRARAEWLKGY